VSNKIKWNASAFAALQKPAAYPTHTRQTHCGGVSHYLYAWEEDNQAKAASRAAARRAKARIGVKVFSWEMGQ
jgi:hypothetical protein